MIDDFTNGLDDNGIGGVDDLTEVEGPTGRGRNEGRGRDKAMEEQEGKSKMQNAKAKTG